MGIPIGICNSADPHHIDHVTQSTGGGHSQQELEHVILILLYLKQTWSFLAHSSQGKVEEGKGNMEEWQLSTLYLGWGHYQHILSRHPLPPLHKARCLTKYIHEIAEKTPQIYFQGSCCASSSQIKTSTTLMRQSKPWECHSKSGRLSLYHEWQWLAAITTTEFISSRLWANSDRKTCVLNFCGISRSNEKKAQSWHWLSLKILDKT